MYRWKEVLGVSVLGGVCRLVNHDKKSAGVVDVPVNELRDIF